MSNSSYKAFSNAPVFASYAFPTKQGPTVMALPFNTIAVKLFVAAWLEQKDHRLYRSRNQGASQVRRPL